MRVLDDLLGIVALSKNMNRKEFRCYTRGDAYYKWYCRGGKHKYRKQNGRHRPFTEYKWETKPRASYSIQIGTSCGYPDYVEHDILIHSSKDYATAVCLRAE